jgi:hypothetical protein
MAFSLHIKRKAVLNNVLESQKILSKHTRSKLHLKAFFTKKIGFISFSCITVSFLFFYIKHNKNSNPDSLPKEFKVVFQGNFPNQIQDKISKTIESVLLQSTSMTASIEDIAKQIQNKESLSHVHLFLSPKKFIHIFVSPKTPLMKIYGSTHLVLSSDGDIYNEYNFRPQFETVLYSDFHQTQDPPVFDEKNCIQLTDKEKKILLDSIILINQSYKNSLPLFSIGYVKHRGFFAKLKDQDTTVVFGDPPFEKQFSRLEKILENSKKRNVSIKNIEVDFNDKAFITE